MNRNWGNFDPKSGQVPTNGMPQQQQIQQQPQQQMTSSIDQQALVKIMSKN